MTYRYFLGPLLLCALLLSWGVMLTMAQHGHWISKYRANTKISCCGLRDCFPRPGVRLLGHEGEKTIVEVDGHAMMKPTTAVQASEDS